MIQGDEPLIGSTGRRSLLVYLVQRNTPDCGVCVRDSRVQVRGSMPRIHRKNEEERCSSEESPERFRLYL